MVAAFQRCAASSIPVPEQLQAMILLAAMPPKWEMLVAIIMQNYDLADIELKHVHETILAQYELEVTRHGKPKGNKPHDANKLSTIKQKHGNPNFSNQEKGSTQQQSSDKPQGKCGKRSGRGRGNDWSLWDSEAHHLHSRSQRAYPGPFKALDAAFDLADQSGIKPTIETVKTLKQRITEQYMDDDEGSDIVDMSEVPNGHEGQDNDWDCQFQPASPSDEPLDWGSDLEDTEASPKRVKIAEGWVL
ncbi:hypothetical protein DFH94DRAFT_699158 [Russula ochroleuca]|uniref:Uncharacterized protein n=1 Tax=Russula ochroleuca TaxID=152965 RepID=A0A9P5JU71_9AGAM|nr:hypothetical protein DFH94DRAFT_699158 [Russula ochroleuca]